jgi:hypothetical protein
VNVRRLWILACALAVAIAVAACGSSSSSVQPTTQPAPLTGHEVGNEINDGSYIQAGPITYQLQVSRELNPYSVQDKPYVQGLPAGFPPPTANQLWYGVFLWAKNQHHKAYRTSDHFKIVDTQGITYYPIKLNPAENPFVWQAQTLPYEGTYPGEDSIPSEGESQGGLLLFKLNSSAYANRPLTLYVLNHRGQKLGSISLDF